MSPRDRLWRKSGLLHVTLPARAERSNRVVGRSVRSEFKEAGFSKEMIETNVNGVFYATRAALPHLVEQKSGHIVNISSRGAFPLGPGPYTEEQRNRRGDIFYGAEKIGLEHFSHLDGDAPA